MSLIDDQKDKLSPLDWVKGAVIIGYMLLLMTMHSLWFLPLLIPGIMFMVWSSRKTK